MKCMSLKGNMVSSPAAPLGAAQRIDPLDGNAYTWDELRKHYGGKYTKREIESYWEKCKPSQVGTKKKQVAQSAQSSKKKGQASGAEGGKSPTGKAARTPTGGSAQFQPKRVREIFQYFDVDRDGRLKQHEFDKMLAAVTLGQAFTHGRYSDACKLAGVNAKEGLHTDALVKLYDKGFADVDAHFNAFKSMRALPEDASVRQQLKKWSKPSNMPRRVQQVAHLSDGTCIVLSQEQLFVFEGGALKDLGSAVAPEWLGTGQLSVEPTRGRGPTLLVFDDGKFKAVEISRKGKACRPRVQIVRTLGAFSKEWGDVEDDEDDEDIWDACLCAGKLHIAAFVQQMPKPSFLLDGEEFEDEEEDRYAGRDSESDDSEDSDDGSDEEEPPIVYSSAPKVKRLVVSHGDEKLDVCKVPPRASKLHISRDCQSCTFCVLIGDVQEEANRGEWYVCALQKDAVPRKISQDPVGRVSAEVARFSPNGTSIVYQGNHTQSHPITTHMDLWLVSTHIDQPSQPKRLTPGSMQIDAFDWVHDRNDMIWLSTTVGTTLCSFILSVSTLALEKIEPAAAFECLPSWNPCTGKAVYPVESVTNFTGLWDEHAGHMTPLPEWSRRFEDIHCETVEWEGPGGATVSGAIYHSSTTPSSDRTLLVWVHGGPTCAWPALRWTACNKDEFNCLALLRSGYLVFVPLYRGTLGFEDSWSKGSIGCQGSPTGDLGDILTGVAHLQRTQKHGCSTRAGIFGESYGGYMTIKAMTDSRGADMFQCGVSWYGYINNRETSLLTGDFTWEHEFVTGNDVWPPPARAEDSFNDLGNIKSPLLLCHGADDDACPVMHSQLVYRSLRRRGIPTDLAIYPGQKHGFYGDKVMHDAHWRTVQWFLHHLPPSSSSTKEQ